MTTGRNNRNLKIIFCCMLCTLTKGWYLCCYKYWRRNLNVYPNIHYSESSFLFRGNSTIQLNKKRTGQDRYLIETNEKSVNDCM